MKLSDKLLLIAGWLESSENDLLVNAEQDEKHLEIVAAALVKAADAFYASAEEVEKIEPNDGLTTDKLDELAAVAKAFDESDDELLRKQASVLDDILFTLAVPENAVMNAKKAEEAKIDELKKKYQDTKNKLDNMNKVSDSIKDIEKSPVAKKYKILEAPLSTRYCPQHHGFGVIRVGEHRYQCPVDGKIYDYETGFTDIDGSHTPGGSVSEQTKVPQHQNTNTIFDTRSQRLGIDNQ